MYLTVSMQIFSTIFFKNTPYFWDIKLLLRELYNTWTLSYCFYKILFSPELFHFDTLNIYYVCCNGSIKVRAESPGGKGRCCNADSKFHVCLPLTSVGLDESIFVLVQRSSSVSVACLLGWDFLTDPVLHRF